MATLPTEIKGAPRGIQNTLAGFVIENETITETPVQEDTDDQMGARADEQVYDTRTDLRLTVYGASPEADISNITPPLASGGKKIVYGGKTYKVDSIEEAGTYNGKRRWNISAHKYDNFPEQG
jgi:hypothetical protein